MSRCGNSRHQLLSNDFLAMDMAIAPEPAPRALDPGDGVLFVYCGADALVITATVSGRRDRLEAALEANPRLRSVWE